MEFHTPIAVSPSPIRIDYQTPLLTLGSCFANVMGKKLTDHKIPALINPFGVIFNPVSIFKTLEAAIGNKNLFLDSFIENNGIWYNYGLHSDFSNKSRDELQKLVEERIKTVHTYLNKVSVITLTFGTAFIYRLATSDEIVANCHKIPASNFRKDILTSENIAAAFSQLYEKIKKKYPSVRFILTVSPVRHLKDGMEENSISKSILRVACHQISKQFEGVDYFPSYEIMMDDLRDYRFYGKDMIHPNEIAEEYIWEKFTGKYMDEKTQSLMKEWNSVRRAITHRAFRPESEAHQKFLKETYYRLEKLSSFMDVKEEMAKLQFAIS